MTEPGAEVVLRMSTHDWSMLMFVLGAGCAVFKDPAHQTHVDKALYNDAIALVNRLLGPGTT